MIKYIPGHLYVLQCLQNPIQDLAKSNLLSACIAQSIESLRRNHLGQGSNPAQPRKISHWHIKQCPASIAENIVEDTHCCNVHCCQRFLLERLAWVSAENSCQYLSQGLCRYPCRGYEHIWDFEDYFSVHFASVRLVQFGASLNHFGSKPDIPDRMTSPKVKGHTTAYVVHKYSRRFLLLVKIGSSSRGRVQTNEAG